MSRVVCAKATRVKKRYSMTVGADQGKKFDVQRQVVQDQESEYASSQEW